VRREILKIWICWVAVIALLVAVTWALMMVPLPGGSAGAPTLNDLLSFLAHIGVFGTIKLLAVLLLQPIVLTYIARLRGGSKGGV
jgi:hypothetical protein